jgi:hypothetical protein
MKTIACLACKTVNDYEVQNCATCGESLVAAKLDQSLAALRATTARINHQSAAASRGGFSSINGFGTTLIDYRPRGDGTWEADRWVIASGIPLVPLGGYVIQPHYEEHTYGRHTHSFSVLERIPLSAKRVARIYLIMAIGVLPLVVGWMNARWLERTLGGGKAFLLMAVCAVFTGYMVLVRTRNDGKVYRPLPPRAAA